MEESRAEELSFWKELSDAERKDRGEADRWAPKDILAHINHWKDRLADRLEAAARGEDSDRTEDFHDENRQVFEANRDRSWEDLLEDEGRIYARLITALDALTKDALDDPERFEWTNGRPLWWSVGFTGYYHSLEHLTSIHKRRGQRELARSIHERVAERMKTLSDAQAWEGTTVYNLACYYALNDYTDLAIENLRQSFKMNPGLIEWSKQDSDLDPLRPMAEFQALYEG
jgi:hypothetical protein